MASYHDALQTLAASIGSDGCTGVPDFFRDCCLEHDVAYATGRTPRGVPISKAKADRRFRDCIQAHSSFRWLSPISWWRWIAVRQFGRGIWTRKVVAPFETPVVGLLGRAVLLEARAARAHIIEDGYV